MAGFFSFLLSQLCAVSGLSPFGSYLSWPKGHHELDALGVHRSLISQMPLANSGS